MSRTRTPVAAEGVSVSAIRQSLQERIARIIGPERLAAPRHDRPWQLGVAEVDAHLPETGLSAHGLHEISPASAPDMAAAIGFATSLAARRTRTCPRPILWLNASRRADEFGRLYGHGLKGLGLSRQQWLTARINKPADMLWALEQALRAKSLSLIIADAPPIAADLTFSRRLSLAAADGATPAILLSERAFTGGTAAMSRWQIKSLPSRADEYDPLAPGAPAWGLSLTRCRGGKPGQWHVEWHHATHHFHLVPRLQPEPAADNLPQTGPGFSSQARPALRLSHRGR